MVKQNKYQINIRTFGVCPINEFSKLSFFLKQDANQKIIHYSWM